MTAKLNLSLLSFYRDVSTVLDAVITRQRSLDLRSNDSVINLFANRGFASFYHHFIVDVFDAFNTLRNCNRLINLLLAIHVSAELNFPFARLHLDIQSLD